MSFQITFGQNNSEAIKLDKDISNQFTITGNLRESSSIIRPVIIVREDLSTFRNSNYMTIPVFGRSYYIENMESLAGGLVQITGRVDVLYSFKDAIRGNTGITRRQENEWNLYLNDGSLSVYQNEQVVTKRIGTGNYPFGNYNYVMTIAGG